MAEAVRGQLAIIRDRKGEVIRPKPEVDETVMGIEQITGVSMVAK